MTTTTTSIPSNLIELSKEQKIQIVNGRRLSVSRSVFDLQIDIIVMTTQGRVEDIAILNQKIQELNDTDVALQQFIESLN